MLCLGLFIYEKCPDFEVISSFVRLLKHIAGFRKKEAKKNRFLGARESIRWL